MNALTTVTVRLVPKTVQRNILWLSKIVLVLKIAHVSSIVFQKNIKNYINSLKLINFIDDCPCQFYDCESGTNPTSPVSTSTTSITSTTTTTVSSTNTSMLILYTYYKDFDNYDQYVLYPDDGKSKSNCKMIVIKKFECKNFHLYIIQMIYRSIPSFI